MTKLRDTGIKRASIWRAVSGPGNLQRLTRNQNVPLFDKTTSLVSSIFRYRTIQLQLVRQRVGKASDQRRGTKEARDIKLGNDRWATGLRHQHFTGSQMKVGRLLSAPAIAPMSASNQFSFQHPYQSGRASLANGIAHARFDSAERHIRDEAGRTGNRGGDCSGS